MTDSGFRQVGRRHVEDIWFLSITMRDVETPSGEVVERIAIEHPGAVAIVPIVDEDIVLIDQYRAPADATILELPAGKLDEPGEDPVVAARRELEEEVGLVGDSFQHLTTIWTSVGFTDERIGIYVTDDVRPGVRSPVGAEESASTVVRMPFTEAHQRVLAGEITDAKTVVGILLAAEHRGAS